MTCASWPSMTARRKLTKERARADLSVDDFLVVGYLEDRAQASTDGFDRTEFPLGGRDRLR